MSDKQVYTLIKCIHRLVHPNAIFKLQNQKTAISQTACTLDAQKPHRCW